MTNEEKIKCMPTEKLANYLAGLTLHFNDYGTWLYGGPRDDVQEGTLDLAAATSEWEKWLKERAK